MRKTALILISILIAVGLTYYFCFVPENQKEKKGEGGTELANPATVYCKKQGGTSDMRTFTDGVKGFCLFDDGSECEEWDFFRGDCQKGERFCKDLCGDSECQEVVCLAVGCPCSETPEICSEDCQQD